MNYKSRTMFSFLILLLIFILPQLSKVQAQAVNVKLFPPPANQLKQADLWRLNITCSGGIAYKAFLITVDLKEKTTGMQAESKVRSVTITGSKILSFNDFKAGITYSNPKLQEAFSKNVNAPDGNYTICVYIKNEKGVEVARDCIEHTIVTVKPEAGSLQLISPADGETRDSKSGISFMWILTGLKPPPPLCSIKIVQVLGNQSASEAIKRNPAWFEKEGIRGTTFNYPASAKKFEEGKKYAWVVKSGEAQSEVWREPFILNIVKAKIQ